MITHTTMSNLTKANLMLMLAAINGSRKGRGFRSKKRTGDGASSTGSSQGGKRVPKLTYVEGENSVLYPLGKLEKDLHTLLFGLQKRGRRAGKEIAILVKRGAVTQDDVSDLCNGAIDSAFLLVAAGKEPVMPVSPALMGARITGISNGKPCRMTLTDLFAQAARAVRMILAGSSTVAAPAAHASILASVFWQAMEKGLIS
jgi:hypothetical protein